MRKILYFFAVCIAIGIVLSTVFANIPIFKYAGKEFLTAISNHNYPHAYSMLSNDVRTKMSIQEFQRNMQEMGLDEYKSVEWTDRSNEENAQTGYIRGNVATKQNTIIHIQINFVLYQGTNWLDKKWTISNVIPLDKTSPDEIANPPTAPSPLPSH